MALTPEEKTQKQIDAAVKAAVKRERATVKSELAKITASVKEADDKAFAKVGARILKDFGDALKSAQAASDAPASA